MKSKTFSTFSWGVVLLVCCAAISAQTNNVGQSRGRIVYADCGTPYELVVLAVKFKVGQLFMLAEEKYFTEQDLGSLFRCLSAKHPEFAVLKITLFSDSTNLDVAIRSYFNPPVHQKPPLDSAKVDCANLDKAILPCPYGYYRATFLRTSGQDVTIRYSPTSSSPVMKEILIDTPK